MLHLNVFRFETRSQLSTFASVVFDLLSQFFELCLRLSYLFILFKHLLFKGSLCTRNLRVCLL